MSNEFIHKTVGTQLTQAEWEHVEAHKFDSQATGDLVYASSADQLSKLGIGSTGAVLTVTGGLPVWDTTWTPTGHLIPASDDSYDLGSSSAAWQDLFLEGDITLTDAGTLATSAGALTITSAAAATWSTSAGALTLTSAGALNLNPASGSAIVLDSTINVDAGVVTGATSITSTAFVGTLSTAAQTNITSLGTLTTLTVDNIIINGTNIGHTSDTDSIAIASDGVVTMNQIPVFSAGINVSGGSIAGTLSTASQTNITGVGTISTGTWQGTAIASTYIAADAITGAKIADDAIDSEHYTDGSIDNAHIADDAIDSEHYADGSIDNAHIADDAIDSEHYAAGSIDTAHIADDQVTLAKMAGLTRGSIIYGNASGNPTALAKGSANYVLTSDGTDIAWAAAPDATNSSHVLVTDNESTNEENLVTFVEGATSSTGNVGLEMDGNLTYNPSSGTLTATAFAGALTGAVTGNADTATLATTVTITDNESTNEDNAIIFTAGGDVDGGNLGLESDGTLTYNPSTGKITATGFIGALTGQADTVATIAGLAPNTATTQATQPNITSLGTLTTLTVDNVITNGTTIGHTSDTDLMTLADGSLTLAGDLTLSDDKSITLGDEGMVIFSDVTPDTDDKGTGIVIKGVATSNVESGDALYLKADGQYERADKDAETTMPAVGVALADGDGSAEINILIYGVYVNAGLSLTRGEELYVSDDGAVSHTVPGSGDFLQRVGVALSTTSVLFMPSLDVIEHA